MTLSELVACLQGWAKVHGAAPKGLDKAKKDKLKTMLTKARSKDG